MPLYARALSLTTVAMRAHNATMPAYKRNSAATRVHARENERRRDGTAAACAIASDRKRETKHKTERSEHLCDMMYPLRSASLFFCFGFSFGRLMRLGGPPKREFEAKKRDLRYKEGAVGWLTPRARGQDQVP